MRGEADHLPPRLPPLRIHHFLVWMAVAAIMLAWARALLGSDYFVYWFDDSLFFLEFLVVSLATTVCGFVFYWRFRGDSFAWEPGHALLLQQAVTLAMRVFSITLHRLYFSEVILTGATTAWSAAPSCVQWFFRWQAQLYALLDVVIFLFSACFIASRGSWRALYLLLAIFGAIQLASCGLVLLLMPALTNSGAEFAVMVDNVLIYLPKVLGVVCLIVLSWREKRAGISRHWSHWCGVVCFLASSVLALGSLLWYDFFAEGWSSYPPTSTTP